MKPTRVVYLCCLFVLLWAAAPLAALGQERRLEPVDEAATDPSWVSFRKRLLAAVEKRDRKYVIAILDRNVRGSLGGKPGIAEFRKAWELDSANTTLWQGLKSALFLGSAYTQREKGPRELCAPYLLGKWPDEFDPHDHGAVITKDVLVKAAPSSDSRTLQTLSHDVVFVRDWEVADQAAGARQQWVKVRVKSGDGYVPEEQIRSPIEHSACFVKTESGWRMIALAPAGG